MKKYFYSDGKQKHGPFTIDALSEKDINKDTLIWFEGLEDWIPASKTKEMASILELKPPPISMERPSKDAKDQPDYRNDFSDSYENKNTNESKGIISGKFSFEGRIRRTEYGISIIIFFFISSILDAFIESGQAPIVGLAYIPLLWFIWAQGAKRCHDYGHSGWFQIIPFYPFYMIFASGNKGSNKYGVDPKQ